MRRTGFKRKELPKQHTIHQPIKAGVFASASGMAEPVPKTEPKRNRALLDMARGRECLLLAPGVDFHDPATVVACHSNLSIHGKAGARKADDHYSVWGCHKCHCWYDQSMAPYKLKTSVFTAAMQRQIAAWRKIAADPSESQKNREAAQLALDQLNKE